MSGIDPAAVEAAARAIHHAQWVTGGGHWAGVNAVDCWETDGDASHEEYRRVARAGLAAAVPHLQAQRERENVDQFRGFCVCDDGRPWADCGIPEHRAAARVVRGDEP